MNDIKNGKTIEMSFEMLDLDIIKKYIEEMKINKTILYDPNTFEAKKEVVQELEILGPESIQYEKRPTYPKILTRIRRFVVVKEHERRFGMICLVGDIFEERFDNPNKFVNVSILERDDIKKIHYAHEIGLHEINWDNKNIPLNPSKKDALELIEEELDVKESYIFLLTKGKKAASLYKSRMKKLSQINEDLTNLRYLLDIPFRH